MAWAIEQYLRSYGPATPASFAPWFGSTPAWAAERMAAHPGLVRVELDGEVAYDLPGASYDAPGAEGVRLLPYFDAFVVGSRPRHLLFPGGARERALSPSGQAGNYPVLLVDGLVAGVWHLKRSGRKAAVTVEPLRRPTRRRGGRPRGAGGPARCGRRRRRDADYRDSERRATRVSTSGSASTSISTDPCRRPP